MYGKAMTGVLKGFVGAIIGVSELKCPGTILMSMFLWSCAELLRDGLSVRTSLDFFRMGSPERYLEEDAARK